MEYVCLPTKALLHNEEFANATLHVMNILNLAPPFDTAPGPILRQRKRQRIEGPGTFTLPSGAQEEEEEEDDDDEDEYQQVRLLMRLCSTLFTAYFHWNGV